MPLQNLATSKFPGVQKVLEPQNEWEKPMAADVDDDVDGEREALPDIAPDIAATGNLSQLHSGLLNASKGVTEETDSEYRR
jgi:hypothetical protein